MFQLYHGENKWAMFQLYHGENKLHFNELMSEAYSRVEPSFGKIKNYKIGICCFSAMHASLRSIRILCPSGATGLTTDYCFSEIAL
jgi:hypothetical protein